MGIFKFIKKSIDEEYDLDNLEDLVYEDEPLESDENVSEDEFNKNLKKYDMSELFGDLGFDAKGNRLPDESDVAGRKKNVKNQKELRKEEEKYDGKYLHNLVKEKLGNTRLNQTLTNVVIPTFDIKKLQPTIFSSFQVYLLLIKLGRIFQHYYQVR